MSEVITVARPYAKAAFDVAVEHKALDKWLEMLTFAAEVAHNDTVQGLLHGSLGTEKLGDLFVQICGDQLNEQGQNLMKVMAENGRLSVLPAVLTEFVALKSELDKQLDASVCSASPLSDADIAKIQASLEKRYGRTVKLNFSIDPSLMAGLVIKAGDEIISGCINMTGVLKIRTIREFGESTVSKILELVENSSSRKSKSENFISKFAKYYTPVVCYGALALAFIPPIVLLIMGKPAMWGDWIYRALTFLVISCPCALVISIPLSFFAGIGGASNQGVLVKGSNYLETLAQTSYVVFDKTGTMTQGVFEVSGVHHNEISDEKLLEYAALAECSSSHPISKSLQKAYGKPIDRNRVTDIEEISGNGVTAKVDGISVAAGNAKLMKRLGISYQECHHVGTVIHMAVDGKYEGHILISDILKPHAKEAIAELKKAGIKKTVMLTGDSKRVADQVAKELGIGEVYSELLPADKVSKVEELLHQKSEKEKLAFVGDGINDAPVLSRADIGIAMGALGSDAAIEAADIVLMDDDPLKISKAIKIARKCIHIVYENIYFAIGIKILCLILGALGIANMWMAIFADVGVMIIAVLNAIRTLFVKNL